ncbi:hypothetical protein HY479_03940 [Candidatus Uhrbacteria bacterium]|nr:hypothetical protein [Candidatus Uhrbacteria bacterium]
MNELIPAILAPDEKTFRERLALLHDEFPVVQIDIMDGAFVPNRTWFDVNVLRRLETPVRFELHLMVMDPGRSVEETSDIASVVRHIWHVETQIDHASLIARCHTLKKEAGLALSPKTPTDTIARHALELDEILIMGAEPGLSGQKLQPQMIDRAWEIHGRWPEIPLGFDIDVNAETIPKLKPTGISRFCAASAIFGVADPLETAKRLRDLL